MMSIGHCQCRLSVLIVVCMLKLIIPHKRQRTEQFHPPIVPVISQGFAPNHTVQSLDQKKIAGNERTSYVNVIKCAFELPRRIPASA